MTEEKVRTEEFQVSGEMLVAKVKELVHESTIRRIIIKNEAGKSSIEIPLILGAAGALLWPVWAAIGVLTALAVHLTLVIEKVE